MNDLVIRTGQPQDMPARSEEHTSELQSLRHLVCRLLLEKKKKRIITSEASTVQLTVKSRPRQNGTLLASQYSGRTVSKQIRHEVNRTKCDTRNATTHTLV